MLTKVGNLSCLKTEVVGKQWHNLCKIQKAPKTYLLKKFVKELAPTLRQLLNRQGMRRISGLQKFVVRFGKGTEVCK